MFDVDRVSKRYGTTYALQEVSLQIQPGQTTVLIGPSGCGKSTLIRILIGLIQPTEGAVSYNSTSLSDCDIRTLRHRMGYVIQDGGLFPHMTARQNACVMAKYLRWDVTRMEERLQELVALTHFPTDGLDRYPTELSGGQRQRVSLMRALMLDPDVLLLDEPLGALDPMIRADLQEELRHVVQTLHKTAIMVTHDLGEAVYIGDVIILMREGQVVQQGTINDLIERPADEFVTRFINAQRSPLADLLAGGTA